MSGVKDILNDDKKVTKIAKQAFESVDADGSGFIEKNELQKVMESVASEIGVDKPTDEDVDNVLKDLDKNGDGKLSFEEFKELIKQVLDQMAKAE